MGDHHNLNLSLSLNPNLNPNLNLSLNLSLSLNLNLSQNLKVDRQEALRPSIISQESLSTTNNVANSLLALDLGSKNCHALSELFYSKTPEDTECVDSGNCKFFASWIKQEGDKMLFTLESTQGYVALGFSDDR